MPKGGNIPDGTEDTDILLCKFLLVVGIFPNLLAFPTFPALPSDFSKDAIMKKGVRDSEIAEDTKY